MGITRRGILQGIGATGALTAARLPGIAAERTFTLADATGSGGAIHLDRNENPYGPPESAVQAMRESLKSPNRYPDRAALQNKIAEHHKVSPEQVVLGCGSTEVLRMAADAFLAPGKKLVLADPTCPILAGFAMQKGAELVKVALNREFAHDLPAMLAQCNASTGLVYICNPNNPTGTICTRSDLDDFLRKLPAGIPVVIDEAYHEYTAPTAASVSFLEQLAADERTIVTRTFSKLYGLAAVRIGYAVAPKALAERMRSYDLPFGENSLGIAGAMAALDDQEFVRTTADRNRADKQRFFNSADVRYIRVTDSHANFTLLKLDNPIEMVITHFRENQIFVGPRFPQLDTFLRVSIGTPEDTKAFWHVWDMLPHKPVHH